MTQNVGLTGDLATGDYKGAASRLSEIADYQRKNPGTPEGKALMQAWDRGAGITGGLQEVGKQFGKDWDASKTGLGAIRSVAKNMQAMGSGVLEQTPNMVAPMGGMLAGGAAGSLATPVVGTMLGGWAGASLGNTAIEGGGMAQEALQKAGIDPSDKSATEAYLKENGDKLLGQAGVKGSIIGAVDTATMRMGHGLLTGPANKAASRAITALGLDITDKAAVKAASGAIAEKMAADPIYKAATSGAQNIARNVGAAALEPAGEFAGEYVGQGAATGDWNEKNAFLEAASSVGQGAATFAGQKMYAGAKKPFGMTDAVDAPPSAAPNQAPTDQAPPLQIGNTPDPLPSFPDGTVARRSEIDAYINSLPAEQQPAARAKMMGLAPQPGTQEPVVKPSEAMGLDPAAGPISAAAVTAVDTGAHQEIQLQQASEADQAAYEQATAEQAKQAAEQDSIDKPITSGPIAEAAMSDEDKRAVLFSNQAVADGGKRYAGTLDGDILNGLGKPYPNRLAAARRANMEGKDWTIAQVQDGFVARRKDANGQTTDVLPVPAGSRGRRMSEPGVGVAPVLGAGSAVGTAVDAGSAGDRLVGTAAPSGDRGNTAPIATTRAQPTALGTQTTATAGPGFTAKDVTRVQNAAPGTNTATAAPAVEAPAVVAGDAATAEGLPNAGSATVEGAGVAPIDQAAHTAATSPLNDLPQPTEAQKIAGNYSKGHVNLNGLDLSIENPAGSVRSGKDKSGKAWSNTLQHHYGYIKGSVGNDKDHVDLFVKPGTPLDYSGQVFVIDQVHPDTGRFDEHKVVVGAKNGMEARRIYQANYAKGWKGFKALTAMPFDQFKTWVKDGPKNKPVSSEKPVSQPQEQTSEKAPKAVEATAQQQAAGPATNPAQPAASDGVAAASEAKPAAAPVAQSGLERMRAAHKAKNAKPVEPVEQPTPPVEQPAQASSSRPGEPSAEQIKSVKDITLTKKVGDSVVKKTSNASKAMKAINERADALEMVRKCLA